MLIQNEIPFLNSPVQIKKYKLVHKRMQVKSLEINYL